MILHNFLGKGVAMPGVEPRTQAGALVAALLAGGLLLRRRRGA